MQTSHQTGMFTQPLTSYLRKSKQGITFIEDASGETTISYQELYENASYCLFNLQQIGLKEGDELVFQTTNNACFLEVFWACLLGKIIPVPLTMGNQADHKLKLLKVWDSLNNPYLISDDGAFRTLEQFVEKEGLNEVLQSLRSRNIEFAEVLEKREKGKIAEVKIDDLAYIQYSSGSTGSPKGVPLTHRNLVTNAVDIVTRSETTAEDAMLSWMPLTHDMGLICFHLSGVVADINQYLMPAPLFIKRPLLWIEKTHEHKITQLYSPNFGYHYFCKVFLRSGETPAWDLSRVRIIYNGAEPISYKVCQKFQEVLQPYGLRPNTMYPGYGMAEASVAVSLPKVGDELRYYLLDRNSLNLGTEVVFHDAVTDETVSFVENGYAIDHCNLRVCDDHGHVLAENHIGNVQIKGGNVTGGYYNNPEATEKIFTEDGWLRTGDLGFLHNGRIVITGRAKNIIIINGQNYYPQDFERLIEKNIPEFGLGKAVACSVRDAEQAEEQLIIFIQTKKKVAELIDVVKTIKRLIPEEIGVPVYQVIPVSRIPKTTSGKIQNFKLVQEYQSGLYNDLTTEIDNAIIETFSLDASLPLSERLLEVWHQLGVRLTSIDEDVIGAGVNSIMATRFTNWINSLLTINIGLNEVFLYPTPAELAAYIENTEARSYPEIQPVQDQAYYLLSAGQRQIWLLQQFSASNTAYNLASLHEFKGNFVSEYFHKALTGIVQSYEILRTTFVVVDGQPYQKINAYEVTDFFKYIDLTDQQDARENALDIARTIAQQPFDLAEGPLFQIVVFKTAEDAHFLLFRIHHIISDGWSIGHLLEEICTQYNTLTAHQELIFGKEDNVQYRDYVMWQEKLLKEGYLEGNAAYWHEELSGKLPVLDLPIAKLRPAVPSFQGGKVSKVLSAGTKKQLQQFSREHNATLFVTLFSSVNLLLHKYSGQRDIIIGTDTNGRSQAVLEGQQGYFLNTLAIRNQIDEQNSIGDLLDQVKVKILKAFQHQDYPFEKVVNEVKQRESFSRNALFDVLVLLQNFEKTFDFEGKLTNVDARSLSLPSTTSLLDLEFEFFFYKETLGFNIKYNTDVFEEALIDRMALHLERILTTIDQHSQTPVIDFEMILPEERQALLDTPGVESNLLETVVAAFENQVATLPDQCAVKCKDAAMTYRQLNEMANRISRYLTNEFGAGPEDKIGILMERSEVTIALLLGVLKSGAVFVPIDPEYPLDRVQFIATNSELKILISREDLVAELDAPAVNMVLFSEMLQRLDRYSAEDQRQAISGEQLAYLLYTSGSTGTPKGVMITHSGLADYASTFQQYFELSSEDKVVQQSSLSFDVAMEEIFPVLCQGGTLLVAPEGGRDIDALAQLVTIEQATILSTTPLVVAALNPLAEKLTSLRILISGGDVLKPDYIDQFFGQVDIYNTYGPTEITICASYYPVENLENASLIGRPTANHQIYIVDEKMRPVPYGIAGEIVVAGAGVARGYFNLPVETSAKFVDNPFENGGRLYKTGDLGLWQPDGNIRFLGRKDQQIKIRGYRVEPDEVRSAILAYGHVQDTVIKVNETAGEKHLVAYLVADEALNVADLNRYLYGRLPNYMVPAHFVELQALPFTVNGKVDYDALPQPEVVSSSKEFIPASNELEKHLVDAWQMVLGKEPIGVTDNFFEAGGNSLKAVQISNYIQRNLGSKLAIKDILIYPTIRQLAALIPTEAAEEYPELVPVGEKLAYKLSPAQKHLWILSQLNSDLTAFNLSWRFSICGKQLKDAVEWAFEQLVARYEVLRTVFVDDDGRPRQLVKKYEKGLFELNYENWIGMSINGNLDVAAKADATQPFDLENGPLMRVRLIQVAQEEVVVILTMHHIICDGFSMDILSAELVQLLQHYHSGSEIDNRPPLIQYKDYVEWSEKIRTTKKGVLQEAFWRGRFAAKSSGLSLPFYQPRPAKPTYNGDTQRFLIPSGLTQRLRHFSEEKGVTFFVTMMTLIKTLLYRYTNQNDITVATPTAGRVHSELEHQIGYYLNTLPIRTNFSDSSSFADLLDLVKTNLYEAFNHQEYPVELLADYLQAQNPEARVSLYDVMLVYQNFDNQVFEEVNKEDSAYVVKNIRDVDNGSSLNDLLFEFNEFSEDLTLKIRYNTDLFTKEQIGRIATHFTTLAETILGEDTVSLNTCRILSTEEETYLLQEVNASCRERDGAKNVLDQFVAQVNEAPDQIAIKHGDTAITYKQLNKDIEQLSIYLTQQFEVNRGKKIGVMLGRSHKTVTSFMAIWKAGASYVPIDPDYPTSRIAFLIEDSGVDLILTEEGYCAKVADMYDNLVTWEQFQKQIQTNASDADKVHWPNIDPDDLAYLMYTSGSTGQPKGVMIPHRAVSDYVQTVQEYFELTPKDRVMHQSSIAFDVSVEEIYPVLCSGGTLIVASAGGRNIEALANTIHEEKATVLSTTPMVVNELNQMADKLNSLRILISGGDKLQPAYIDRLFDKMVVYNTYGPTESTVCATYHRIERLENASLIGQPITNRRIYLLDQYRQLVPTGVPGELYIGGSGLALGYYNRPDETHQRFIDNPFRKGERLYNAGDLAVWTDSGNLRFIGRNDDQIKIRGYRIELGEIENCLSNQPQVRQAAVLLDQRGAQSNLVAFYQADQLIEPAILHRWTFEHLPEYMLPDTFVFLNEMPLNANGKIDRHQLLDIRIESGQGRYQQPESATQWALASIWENVLDRESIGIRDNFFSIGGHSIKATKMASLIWKTLGVKIGIADIFANPTIEALAGIVEESNTSVYANITALDEQEYYAVTNAQKRLWIIDQFKAERLAYNIAVGGKIEGALDVDLLRHSILALMKRHESLRTTFHMVDGELKQKIHPLEGFYIDFEYVILSDIVDKEAVLREISQRAENVSFDLSAGPLFKVGLVEFDQEERYLFITFHHIISDAWSVATALQELMALYNAKAEGKEHQLRPLVFQQKEYAAWFNQRLSSGAINHHRDYWLRQFAGELATLDLPSDYSRPANKTVNGAHYFYRLNKHFKQELEDFSSVKGASLFMTLLAGLKALFYRYTRMEDITIGSAVAVRDSVELEPQIGFYINTLALRTQFSAQGTFDQLLENVKATALAAYAHQEYPFDLLVEDLKLQRDLSRSPLFDVMMVMQNAALSGAQGALTLKGLDIKPYDMPTTVSKFDLNFNFFENNGGLLLKLEYNTDLFKSERIEKMVQHYITILQSVVRNAQQSLNELEYISIPERKQLELFNQNELPIAQDCILREIEQQARMRPDAVAVRYRDEQWTYGQLNNAANQIAFQLREEHGVRNGDLVGLMIGRSERVPIAVLAILKAGAAYVPIDPSYPEKRIQYIIEDAQPKVIVSESAYRSYFGVDKSLLLLDHQILEDKVWPNPAHQIDLDQLAYIIYTSGSTGNPKGTKISHKNLNALIAWAQEEFKYDAFDIVFAGTSYCFDLSVFEMIFPLSIGKALRILPSALEITQYLKKEKNILVNTVPSVIETLVKQGVKFANVVSLNMAGEPIPYYLKEQLDYERMKVRNLYGPSEDTTYSSCYQFRKEDDIMLIGKPIANTQFYILDEFLNQLPVGVIGEIGISGDGLAQGYLYKPELTQQKFIDHPFEEGKKLYLTGDLARWRADGNIEFIGRKDTQIKLRGFRIELGEIESVISQVDEVEKAVVLLCNDIQKEPQLRAFYTVTAPVSDEVVLTHLKASIPAYMIPAQMMQMEAFPLTPNGKIDKIQLSRLEFTTDRMALVAPRDMVEERLAAMWKEIIKLEEIGIRDDFFALGGHSLQAIQLMSRISQEFDVQINITDIFNYSTIEKLAKEIKNIIWAERMQLLDADNILIQNDNYETIIL